MASSITFLGDLSMPVGDYVEVGASYPEDLFARTVVNLEGAIGEKPRVGPFPRVYSSTHVLEHLASIRTAAVCLANNHITDLSDGISKTIDHCREVGIDTFGAGPTAAEAASPSFVVLPDGSSVGLIAFGWPAIRCRPASQGGDGVNPLTRANVLQQVRGLRSLSDKAYLAVLFHWNYEYEPYPQPAHRELARLCVEEGADVVVGHHPHIVGGLEYFGGKPVLYSLGNWHMPSGNAFGPDMSFVQEERLAVQWAPSTGQIRAHWFSERGRQLIWIRDEDGATSAALGRLTPFAGLSDTEYRRWFRRNRRRRKGLPVFEGAPGTLRDLIPRLQVYSRDRLVRLREVLRWLAPGVNR